MEAPAKEVSTNSEIIVGRPDIRRKTVELITIGHLWIDSARSEELLRLGVNLTSFTSYIYGRKWSGTKCGAAPIHWNDCEVDAYMTENNMSYKNKHRPMSP